MQQPWGRSEPGLFQGTGRRPVGWSTASEGQGGGKARLCLASCVSMVTSVDFILIATGSHRKVYEQGNDHYDLLLGKTSLTQLCDE